MDNQVILPIFSNWLNIKRLSDANVCSIDDIKEHATELRYQGFRIDFNKPESHVRVSYKKNNRDAYPKYWNSKRHKVIWRRYVYGTTRSRNQKVDARSCT